MPVQWMMKIAHVRINAEVSLLLSHSAMLRQEHLEAALLIMDYLKLRHNSRLVFDLSYPEMGHIKIWEYDWTDIYVDAVEAIPPNAPPWKRKEVYLNISLINWYSKEQSTIETSIFGMEFINMKVIVESFCAI